MASKNLYFFIFFLFLILVLSTNIQGITLKYVFGTSANSTVYIEEGNRCDEDNISNSQTIPFLDCSSKAVATSSSDFDSIDNNYKTTLAYNINGDRIGYQLAYVNLSNFNNITSINWTWVGKIGTNGNLRIFLFNFTLGNWTQYNISTSLSDIVVYNYETNISNVVNSTNSNQSIFLVAYHNTGVSNSYLYTDFLTLEVTYAVSTPEITLHLPNNNTNFSTNNNNFYCNYTDLYGVTGLVNGTLYVYNSAGSLNDTNTTTITGSSNYTNLSMNLSDGIFYWNCLGANADNSSFGVNKTFIIDKTGPTINIVNPADTSTLSSNVSMNLDYIVSDVLEINQCWYSLDGAANVSLASCLNITFNTTDGLHTIELYANDSLNNLGSSSSTFSISLSSPAIVFNSPLNYTFYNSGTNIIFNFTATDINGLDIGEMWGNFTGTWHKNYTWDYLTNASSNYTKLNLSEGFYIWNIWTNDSLGNGNFSLFNLSVYIDLTNPIVENITVSTSGSQTFTFSSNASDTYLSNCFYSIYNSSGHIEIVGGTNLSNKTLTCNSDGNTDTVSAYGEYMIRVYANDTANNINYSSYNFSVSANTTPSSGGGGGTLTVVKVKVIALLIPELISYKYSDLQRAILYSRINDFCRTINLTKTTCFLNETTKKELLKVLLSQINQDFNSNIDKWITNYNNKKIENVEVKDEDYKLYKLDTTGIEYISSFQISSKIFDNYWIVNSDIFSTSIQASMTLSNCSIIDAKGNWSCEIDGSIAKINLKLDKFPPNWFMELFSVRVSYTNQDGDTKYQNLNVRAINIRNPIAIFIISSIIIILMIFGFRKKIFRRKNGI